MLRNVIMISPDQQKVDSMGCVNPSYYTTNLDKLVDRSEGPSAHPRNALHRVSAS